LGVFDVLIGINLLREGLDMPEVSLVAILDADKEGFLRSNRSLTQTAGRAARNINGKVIMYADKITDSMQRTIDETDRRRAKQMEYNSTHNITPTPVKKSTKNYLQSAAQNADKAYVEPNSINVAADPLIKYMDKEQLKKQAAKVKRDMERAARALDFIEAARLRDEMIEIEKLAENI